ncbi:MAG: hypothetical protein ACRDPY_06225 [Streptosporangiaceae bacterium]
MTSPPSQPGQHIAAEMEGDNPVRDYHSHLYLVFPHYLAAPGTVVTAPDSSELTTRIRILTAELAIAARHSSRRRPGTATTTTQALP